MEKVKIRKGSCRARTETQICLLVSPCHLILLPNLFWYLAVRNLECTKNGKMHFIALLPTFCSLLPETVWGDCWEKVKVLTLFGNLQSGIKGINERRLYKAGNVYPVRLKKKDCACAGPCTRSWVTSLSWAHRAWGALAMHSSFNKCFGWLSCQARCWALRWRHVWCLPWRRLQCTGEGRELSK